MDPDREVNGDIHRVYAFVEMRVRDVCSQPSVYTSCCPIGVQSSMLHRVEGVPRAAPIGPSLPFSLSLCNTHEKFRRCRCLGAASTKPVKLSPQRRLSTIKKI